MARGERTETPNHIDQRTQGQINVVIGTYPANLAPNQSFDTEADPDEMHNLANNLAYTDVLAEIKPA